MLDLTMSGGETENECIGMLCIIGISCSCTKENLFGKTHFVHYRDLGFERAAADYHWPVFICFKISIS